MILVVACKEDPSIIGLELLKDSEILNIGTIDTISIEAFTVEPEHLVTGGQLAISPLGSYVDSIYGKLKAEFLAQYAFSNYVEFDNNPISDSLIIELFCKGNYGNSEFKSKINVYELTSDLVDSINYYSDFDPAGMYNPNKINISEATIKKLNINTANNDSLLIRIKLSNDYAQQLINPAAEDDSLFYSADTIFRSYIKGLYFSVDQVEEDGLIVYAAPSNVLSRIVLYYHNDEDTLEYEYYFYGSYTSVNSYNFNNHNEAEIPYLNDEIFQDTAIYLQSLGGTAANIKFPYLSELIDDLGRVSVHKAELIIPVITDSIEQQVYDIPQQLGLRLLNVDGEESLLPDDPYIFRYSGYFGGTYDSQIKAYKFNISNYFQDLFLGGEYYDLRLFVGSFNETNLSLSYNISEANRVVLASGNNTTAKISLNIFYTRIP